MIEENEIPKTWEITPLETLLDYIQPTKYIVESTDYDDSYKTPVLTAGKSFLLGYTNETQGIFNQLPTIIFDDFTTAIKFVNFPFKVKSSAMKILVPTCELVNIRYVYYFMETIRLSADTHKRYWISEGAKIPIPIPPQAEQERLVAKIEELFSELDKGIETLKIAKQQLKVYRQAVLKYAFEGRLTNPEVKEGELPEGWIAKNISELGKVKGGKRLPKGHVYSDFKTKYPYLRVTDFNNLSIDKKRLKYLKEDTHLAIKNYTISKDDVYISIAGSIGLVGTIPIDLDGANLTENAAKITGLTEISNIYLALYLNSGFAQKQISQHTIATTQPKLSLFRIDKIKVNYPISKIDQSSIIQEIESRISVCDKIEESIEQGLQQAEALRQSILKKAFEGKLVSQDSKDEPASILLERIKAERQKVLPVKKAKVKLKKVKL